MNKTGWDIYEQFNYLPEEPKSRYREFLCVAGKILTLIAVLILTWGLYFVVVIRWG